MFIRVVWLLLLALALLGAAPAHAAKRVALVVGNAAYAHAQPLLNAKNDAADIAAALRDIGFEVIERQDLDARGMREDAREFAHKIKGAELALFYYAGHAVQLEGGNYLVPTDARIEDQADVPLSTVDLAHIVGAMESEKRANVIFIDACRDNPFLRAVFPATRSTGSHGLAPVSTGVGTLIAFGTAIPSTSDAVDLTFTNLFEPGAPTERTLSAQISDTCADKDVTVTDVKVNAIGLE